MTLEPDNALSFAQDVVVENVYSEQWLDLVNRAGQDMVLDLGSGNNPLVFDHVVKIDVFALPNVDVVGLAEGLPFRDGTFRTVFSGAVFEHLRDPFRAIDDVSRVLREGGDVYIETAFLQPVHAFPDHYFNMTLRGLERLCSAFERLDSGVRAHQTPSFMLRWVLQVWAMKLPDGEREDFMRATVADILKEYSDDVFSKRWMTQFTRKDMEQLAAGVYFHGYKRPEGAPRRPPPEGTTG
jgi:ubiquinone/menaquinone biosynthesis C-methylase UbiE